MQHHYLRKVVGFFWVGLFLSFAMQKVVFGPWLGKVYVHGRVDETMYRSFWINTKLFGVKKFVINSGGGWSEYGHKIGEFVNDNDLVIIVSNKCLSACGDIFLAAKERIVYPGAIVGFHHSGIGTLAAFKEHGAKYTPALEQDAAIERRFLSIGAANLLAEAMNRIEVREVFLAPYDERPSVVGEHFLSYYDFWIPEEEDYRRFGIEVTFMEPKISACEAWGRLAFRPTYRFVFGARPVGRECAPKAN